MKWTSLDCINDWLDYLDQNIIYLNSDGELWHNSKAIVLDTIEILDYLRQNTDNIPAYYDNRFQKLLDICQNNCRNDYFHRFLGIDKRHYAREDLWWIDCWQSIRLNNILHEYRIRSIFNYFETSEGKNFSNKWRKFYNLANRKKYERNSLPAFSYLECIRLIINLEESIDDEFYHFIENICVLENDNLKFFPNSNELRSNSLILLNNISTKYGKDVDKYRNDIWGTLKTLIKVCEWDQYSHTWVPSLLKINDDELLQLIRSKISDNGYIDSKWVSGNNFPRKARYAFLLLYKRLNIDVKYFEIIEPNRFVYAPIGYVNLYVHVGRVMDKILQGLKEIEDIQNKVKDGDIKEQYFKDQLIFGIKSVCENDPYIKWSEKEKRTTSGRISDIYINIKRGVDIPIEVKILWRFSDGYEPIIECLEQVTEGTFGIVVVINPPNNPEYKGKYHGFDGWRKYVEDHDTFVPGTITQNHDRFTKDDELKSRHFFSDHNHTLKERRRNITLLNYFIELSDFIRSPYLT